MVVDHQIDIKVYLTQVLCTIDTVVNTNIVDVGKLLDTWATSTWNRYKMLSSI